MSNRTLVPILAFVLLAPLVPLSPAAEAIAAPGPTYQTFRGPTQGSGEPSVGVDWETGEIFYQNGAQTYRVGLHDDGGSDWELVSPLHTFTNVDPMLFTDSATGRTWAGGLDGPCSLMGITEDGGRSWIPAGNMCVATLDHQTIAAGPWAQPLPPDALSDRATYYCAQAVAVTCIRSLDNGLTWGVGVPVSCGAALPGLHGSLTVGPTGVVYLPFKRCGGGAGFARSFDNGLTWSSRRVTGAIAPGGGFDADVATSPSGRVWIGYADGPQNRAMVAWSDNHGDTWTGKFDVGAPAGVVASTFHEMVAGDHERAAVAFLGTTTPGDPFAPGFAGVWDLYVSTTYDSGATWTTVKASTDPVQRGFICDGGIGCNSGRNLLDFMDAQVDAFGRIVVAYADGCIDACAAGTSSVSRADAATLTRQASGLTLFARFDAASGALFATGHGPYTARPGAAIALDGAAANGVAPYAYEWSVVQRPDASTADAGAFDDASAASPAFTPDVAGRYVLRFAASDAHGARAVDLVDVFATHATTGTPIEPCSVALASDPAGDSSAAAPGTGRRDLTALAASDQPGLFTVCVSVADFDDAPNAQTRIVVSWEANYEAPGLTYHAVALLGASGTVSGQVFRGVAGSSPLQLGTPAIAAREGDTILVSVPKPAIGGPQDGEQATNVFARTESVPPNLLTLPVVWDRAPDASGATFTFGHLVGDASAPTAVATLDATVAPGEGIDLVWSAATDDVEIADYVLRRSTVDGGPYQTIALVRGLAHRDVQVADGVTYHYVVAARDTAGNLGGFSPQASATMPGGSADTTPPTAASDLEAPHVGAFEVVLAWSAAADEESGVERYKIRRDGLHVGSTEDRTYRDRGVEPGTSYLYEIHPVNGAGLDGPAVSLVVTTPVRPEDCGQLAAPFELLSDAEGDSTRGDRRSDLVRVGIRETAARLWFHVGVVELAGEAAPTIFRVAWDTSEAHGYAIYGQVDDGGPTQLGLFLRTPGGEVGLSRPIQIGASCSSLLLGVQKADLLSPEPGSVLGGVRVTTHPVTTARPPGQTIDGAPEVGGMDYVVGSAT